MSPSASLSASPSVSPDNGWIDVHAHLEMLTQDPAATVQAAKEAGVDQMITIGCHPKDFDRVLQIAEKYYPTVGCTLGAHPHEAIHYSDETEAKIRKHATEPWFVGVGEIGLDFHYDHSPRDTQIEVFRRQTALAKSLKMPIQIHSREAEKETADVIREFKGDVIGLFHCFTSSKWLAEQALDLGYNISLSGVLTFKNAEDLRNIAKFVPIDRLHVETDAPFLTPVPFRGKENTPSYVVKTAELLAQLKGVSVDELKKQTRQNTYKLFPKLKAAK